MKKKLGLLLCAMLCAALLALSASAEARTGTLTIKLEPVQYLPDTSGVRFGLYRVGAVAPGSEDGNGWKTDGVFADVDFEHAMVAAQIEAARDEIGQIVTA